MTQKERLLLILKDMRLGQAKFEDEIGASRGSISHINENVSPTFRAKIKERYPDINLQWLIAGVGDMYIPKDEQPIPRDRKLLLQELTAQRELLERLTTQMSRLNDNIYECQKAITMLLAKL